MFPSQDQGRQTDRQTDRKTDRQTDRQTDSWGRQTDRQFMIRSVWPEVFMFKVTVIE